MIRRSIDRSASHGAALALGAVCVAGSAVLMSAPAGAEPPVPPDVAFQCSVFYGPNQTFPHPLENCVAPRGTTGGFTQRESLGTERIIFNQGFLAGQSVNLTNVQSTVLGRARIAPRTTR
jgi:hypothetical protein